MAEREGIRIANSRASTSPALKDLSNERPRIRGGGTDPCAIVATRSQRSSQKAAASLAHYSVAPPFDDGHRKLERATILSRTAEGRACTKTAGKHLGRGSAGWARGGVWIVPSSPHLPAPQAPAGSFLPQDVPLAPGQQGLRVVRHGLNLGRRPGYQLGQPRRVTPNAAPACVCRGQPALSPSAPENPARALPECRRADRRAARAGTWSGRAPGPAVVNRRPQSIASFQELNG